MPKRESICGYLEKSAEVEENFSGFFSKSREKITILLKNFL